MKSYKAETLIPNGESLYVFSANVTGEMETHDHDFPEIVYIRDGSATECVDGESYEVHRGDLIFVPVGSTHRFVPHGSLSYVNICFLPELLGTETPLGSEHPLDLLQLSMIDELRQGSECAMISFSSRERGEIEMLLCGMLMEYHGKSRYRRVLLSGYMQVLLCRILEKTEAMRMPEEDVWQSLVTYIDEHLEEGLSLGTLAQRCFYNPSYFSRMFKERFGTTLTDYVSERRLSLAERLNVETALTVTQIAERAGFGSTGALHRASLKLRGVRFIKKVKS